ncbi:MAG: monofunctional biosynthetic peptidoglycan transglycosylase [Acidobacteria bacterium]|nr:monofunctional biosynthetic peptidoglycan transglycosylase [Acidobacteriota bacterium]
MPREDEQLRDLYLGAPGTTTEPEKPKAERKPGRKRHLVRWILLGLLGFILLSVFLFWVTLPNPGDYREKNPETTAIIAYREAEAEAAGKPLRRLWTWVPLSKISKNLIRAVITTEDDKFYAHDGFDWEAIREAWQRNLEDSRITRGGSTITQQCAKNLYLSPERSWWRKVREAAITWYMERNLSKDRILEIYLNIIEWGDGVYGAEAAARFWFKKSAAALTVPEAVRLASVIANPHIYNPLDDKSPRMRKKRSVIAFRLVRQKWAGGWSLSGLRAALGLKQKDQDDVQREYPGEFKLSETPAQAPATGVDTPDAAAGADASDTGSAAVTAAPAPAAESPDETGPPETGPGHPPKPPPDAPPPPSP